MPGGGVSARMGMVTRSARCEAGRGSREKAQPLGGRAGMVRMALRPHASQRRARMIVPSPRSSGSSKARCPLHCGHAGVPPAAIASPICRASSEEKGTGVVRWLNSGMASLFTYLQISPNRCFVESGFKKPSAQRDFRQTTPRKPARTSRRIEILPTFPVRESPTRWLMPACGKAAGGSSRRPNQQPR